MELGACQVWMPARIERIAREPVAAYVGSGSGGGCKCKDRAGLSGTRAQAGSEIVAKATKTRVGPREEAVRTGGEDVAVGDRSRGNGGSGAGAGSEGYTAPARTGSMGR